MNLLDQILDRASPERKARRLALIEATAQAFNDCRSLPQFLHATHDGRHGLLNVINGCFLMQPEPDAQGLCLAWHRCASGGQPQALQIEAMDQIEQFTLAMQAQAQLLDAYLPRRPHEGAHT